MLDMKRREFHQVHRRRGAGLPDIASSIADPALPTQALIAALNTRASAEGDKSLP